MDIVRQSKLIIGPNPALTDTVLFLAGLYIIRMSRINIKRISLSNLKIQDGHQVNFLNNSHIISSSNTFSTMFGIRNQFLGLFLQFDFNNAYYYRV